MLVELRDTLIHHLHGVLRTRRRQYFQIGPVELISQTLFLSSVHGIVGALDEVARINSVRRVETFENAAGSLRYEKRAILTAPLGFPHRGMLLSRESKSYRHPKQ